MSRKQFIFTLPWSLQAFKIPFSYFVFFFFSRGASYAGAHKWLKNKAACW